MKYTPKGYEGKVYSVISETQDKGITKVELRAILANNLSTVKKTIENLKYRNLIEERDGKYYKS